jgi:hypothetical protein
MKYIMVVLKNEFHHESTKNVAPHLRQMAVTNEVGTRRMVRA